MMYIKTISYVILAFQAKKQLFLKLYFKLIFVLCKIASKSNHLLCGFYRCRGVFSFLINALEVKLCSYLVLYVAHYLSTVLANTCI